jgi:hypothetical protein
MPAAARLRGTLDVEGRPVWLISIPSWSNDLLQESKG